MAKATVERRPQAATHADFTSAAVAVYNHSMKSSSTKESTARGNQLKSLPLYNSFRYDAASECWTMDEDVLHRCLVYAKFSKRSEVRLEDALHWLSEQEYVVGAALLTQVGKATSGTEMPKSHGHCHPIASAASFVLTGYAHWGTIEDFCKMWIMQVRIVVEIASPASQNTYPVDGELLFSSDMECGNLARVERRQCAGVTPMYLLWIAGDPSSNKKLWFRFSVQGARPKMPLLLRIMNLTPNAKLSNNDIKPVWSSHPTQPMWRATEGTCIQETDEYYQLSFFIMPLEVHDTIHVAFSVPYGYSDLLHNVSKWHGIARARHPHIRFEERVLCRSLDGRKLHLLIITSRKDECKKGSFDAKFGNNQLPFANFSNGKKVVLISGRVHPGEVTASHAVHSIISFLLSAEPEAMQLLEHFIFFIVPMINPDGVARGNMRTDQNGINLNRCYTNPSAELHPSVCALRGLHEHLQNVFGSKFMLYLDFHSHASVRDFVFGNCLFDLAQDWNMFYARLMCTHSPEMDFDCCRFSRKDMLAKDGTSRVLFGTGSHGILNSYTVECTFLFDGDLEENNTIIACAARVGRASLLALLDYCNLSKAPQAELLRLWRDVRRDRVKLTLGKKKRRATTS